MGEILTDVDEMYLAWSSLKQSKNKKHRKAMSNILYSTNYIFSPTL